MLGKPKDWWYYCNILCQIWVDLLGRHDWFWCRVRVYCTVCFFALVKNTHYFELELVGFGGKVQFKWERIPFRFLSGPASSHTDSRSLNEFQRIILAYPIRLLNDQRLGYAINVCWLYQDLRADTMVLAFPKYWFGWRFECEISFHSIWDWDQARNHNAQ